MGQEPTKSALPPHQRFLLEQMQGLNFGRIRNIQVM
jgi:hypothetical protein